MKNTCTTLSDYIEQVCNQASKNDRIFRGVSNASYSLVPKAGRKSGTTQQEREMINEFMMYGVPYSSHLAQLQSSQNDITFEALAIAQHHGLPTRLLDWTSNPLVALFFACRGNENVDGAVFIAQRDQFNAQIEDSPLDCDSVFLYQPAHVTSRISAQEGLFTVHPTEFLNIDLREIPIGDSNELLRSENISIPSACKRKLIADLDIVGINEEALFPDLDGLARYLEWKYTSQSCNQGETVHE